MIKSNKYRHSVVGCCLESQEWWGNSPYPSSLLLQSEEVWQETHGWPHPAICSIDSVYKSWKPKPLLSRRILHNSVAYFPWRDPLSFSLGSKWLVYRLESEGELRQLKSLASSLRYHSIPLGSKQSDFRDGSRGARWVRTSPPFFADSFDLLVLC